MAEIKKRAGNVILEQKNVLVDYLELNPKLVKGKFNSQFTKKMGQEKWIELSEMLNAIPGATKTWMQWRKTWQDIRTKTKRVKAKLGVELRGTGGGPSTASPLDFVEEKVARMIQPTSVYGQPDIQESAVEFSINSDAVYDPDAHEDKESNCMAAKYLDDALPYVCTQPKTMTECVQHYKKETMNEKAPIKRRSVPSQRLQKSIAEKEQLIKLTAVDIHLRKRYYKRKIETLERIAVAHECIASAKEQESSALERITVAIEAYLKH